MSCSALTWIRGTARRERPTDDGAGVAVTMEAVRIPKASSLQPRRTIRLALWSGGEGGLRGSRAYVAVHSGTVGDGSRQAAIDATGDARLPADLRPKPGYEKLSVYFNPDSGTGKIGGVHLQGNEGARVVLRAWHTPFRDVGVSTIPVSNLDGSDNLLFDVPGLPSFRFIQDPVGTGPARTTRTWTSFDRVRADDLKHTAAVMAAFVYNAAMADAEVPRKVATRRANATGSN